MVESGDLNAPPSASAPEGEESAQSATHLTWSQSAMLMGPYDPVAHKLTDGHIATLIDNDEAEGRRRFVIQIVRIVALIVLLLMVLAFVGLFCWLFARDEPDLLEKVLIGVLSFGGGVGAGLGAPRLLSSIDDR